MKNIIENSLVKGISYEAYRTLVSDLLAEGKATGDNQSEDYLNYSKLGNARMKRLDKKFQLSERASDKIRTSTKKLTWLVLTEGWCGDAAHALPILNKVAEESENIELKVVLRDENSALMDEFLTNGGKSIPKLIVLDAATHTVIDSWGPRPSEATKMVNEYKETHGSLDANFKEDLQVWYNKNNGANIEADILNLI
tara:strand:+ start:173171 stop:173761 length:591 start_codon:yes stop_codon:yes gene_type:complete